MGAKKFWISTGLCLILTVAFTLEKVVENYDCQSKNKKMKGWYCTVTDSEDRKYLTKEEERRAKMIKLDKQTELDAQYGSNSKDAKRAKR